MSKNIKNEINELLPTTETERTLSLLDFTLLWSGMTINIAGFVIGAQLYPNLSPVNIIYAMLCGYLIVTVLLVLTGDIGIRYGIPFAVYARLCFGQKGSLLAGFIRAIPCFFWFGFQTWIGAMALNEIIKIFLGYSNLTILIIAFGGLQIYNAAYGVKAMAKFAWIAIPSLAAVLGFMIIWLLKVNNATIIDVLFAPSNNTASFSYAVMGIAGGWITMALNSPDLTRNLKRDSNYAEESFLKRNRNSLIAQMLGLVLVGSALTIVGMTAGILTGVWNPIDVIVDSFSNSNPLILIISFLAVIFAQWSTNTAANLLPPAYILINAFPKLNFKKAILLSGILGVAFMPWKFSAYLVQFQVLVSGLLGPIVGIMICDYYLIRKQKLDTGELFKNNGIYSYKNDINTVGVLSMLISFAVAVFFPEYAFFVGFFISFILYYLLMVRSLEKVK
jgi:nucleobase:cation symporter-1, NCS1 family